MIHLDLIGSESSDATSVFNVTTNIYNVRFDHPYTVGELIKEFYEDNEYGNWGEVRIGKTVNEPFGEIVCYYRSGEWEVECPEKYLDRVIKSALCYGKWSLYALCYGEWSLYDFMLVLEEMG